MRLRSCLPQRQSCCRSLASRLATFCRPRLDIQPVAASSRMLASTNGRPVRPEHHLRVQPRAGDAKQHVWYRAKERDQGRCGVSMQG